jgi:hypothetical protein
VAVEVVEAVEDAARAARRRMDARHQHTVPLALDGAITIREEEPPRRTQ